MTGASGALTPHFRELLDRARAWCQDAHAAGWLPETDLARLDGLECGAAGDLFEQSAGRPLVVALFGGTGVGKSSLLNRLAGAPVARTGVERPTSREATLYVHEQVQLADLPPGLPLASVRVQRHTAPAHRDILWLDAPDIDSTAESNRRAALGWLPHVDLVCYVVSPERYRDDVGWRVLRERGHRHGWVFVMNRWDEGNPRQVADFARMLQAAGFENPVLVTTACVPDRPLPGADELPQLAAALDALLAAQGVDELSRLGQRRRLEELHRVLGDALRQLGSEGAWAELTGLLDEQVAAAAATIRAVAEWNLRATAAQFAGQANSLFASVRRGWLAARGAAVPAAGAAVPAAGSADSTRTSLPRQADAAGLTGGGVHVDQLAPAVWDDWARGKLAAVLDLVELAARQRGLTAGPVRTALAAAVERGERAALDVLREAVRSALARPGSWWTRAGRRVTGFCMVVLPVLALVWVAWKVLRGYYAADGGGVPFLGAPFAIHSASVMLIAWGLPFYLDRLLKPSIERTVREALAIGLEAALRNAADELAEALAGQQHAAAELHGPGAALQGEISAQIAALRPAAAPAVERVLMKEA